MFLKFLKNIFSSKSSPKPAPDTTSNTPPPVDSSDTTNSIVNDVLIYVGKLKDNLVTPKYFDPYFDPYSTPCFDTTSIGSCPDSTSTDSCSDKIQKRTQDSAKEWKSLFRQNFASVAATIYHQLYSNSSPSEKEPIETTPDINWLNMKKKRKITCVSDLICFNINSSSSNYEEEQEKKQQDESKTTPGTISFGVNRIKRQEREQQQKDALQNALKCAYSRSDSIKKQFQRRPPIQYNNAFLDEEWNCIDKFNEKRDID